MDLHRSKQKSVEAAIIEKKRSLERCSELSELPRRFFALKDTVDNTKKCNTVYGSH